MKYKLGDNVLIYDNYIERICKCNYIKTFKNTNIKYIISMIDENTDCLKYRLENDKLNEIFWIPEELIYSLQEERLKKLERFLEE